MWFSVSFSWDSILEKTVKPPFMPKVEDVEGAESISAYPDSPELPEKLAKKDDPFIDW